MRELRLDAGPTQPRPAKEYCSFQAVLTPAKAHYDIAAVYEQMGRRTGKLRIEYAKALELDPQLIDAKSKLATLGNQ